VLHLKLGNGAVCAPTKIPVDGEGAACRCGIPKKYEQSLDSFYAGFSSRFSGQRGIPREESLEVSAPYMIVFIRVGGYLFYLFVVYEFA
jgi:hypothetical protein